jgi:hypothetical protein
MIEPTRSHADLPPRSGTVTFSCSHGSSSGSACQMQDSTVCHLPVLSFELPSDGDLGGAVLGGASAVVNEPPALAGHGAGVFGAVVRHCLAA